MFLPVYDSSSFGSIEGDIDCKSLHLSAFQILGGGFPGELNFLMCPKSHRFLVFKLSFKVRVEAMAFRLFPMLELTWEVPQCNQTRNSQHINTSMLPKHLETK